jgi:D-serine deaminase-like pyridoxal phosphate-dependent protein
MTLGEVDTPSALVDAERLERNLREMAVLCGRHGKRLRPHFKTHKTIEIAARQRDLGAAGLTVAKVGEAEALADAGFDDLLVCYPMVGPVKLARLAALASRATVSTVVDSQAGAGELSAAMARAGLRLDVLVKLDAGMHRVGVPHGQAVQLASAVAGLDGLRLRGVCIHEGGVYNEPDPARRRSMGRDQVRRLVDTAQALRAAGLPVDVVSCGATPSIRDVIDIDGVTEVRPGNYVFYDAIQVALGVVPADRCALSVLTTVVSLAAPGRGIVDAGSKVLTLDRGAHGHVLVKEYGRVLGRRGVVLAALSEEHGWLAVSGGAAPLRIGDQLRILPNHACAVVSNFDRLTVMRDGGPAAEWNVIARGGMALRC